MRFDDQLGRVENRESVDDVSAEKIEVVSFIRNKISFLIITILTSGCPEI